MHFNREIIPMLKKTMLSIVASFAMLLSLPSQAAFVSTDWKTQGDALATLDTETGIEWLDVSLTDGMSIDSVKALLGSVYAGWRLPTMSEVESMYRRFFYVVPDEGVLYSNYQVYQHEHEAFYTLFGGTYGPYYSYGTYLGDNGFTVYSTGSGGTGAQNSNIAYVHYIRGNDAGTPDSYAGVFLVSDGGVTLSSINDPTLNENNPNAPLHVADVSAPIGGSIASLLLLLCGARRKVA